MGNLGEQNIILPITWINTAMIIVIIARAPRGLDWDWGPIILDAVQNIFNLGHSKQSRKIEAGAGQKGSATVLF